MNFEEALADLIAEYLKTTSKDAIMSAMELQLMALNESDET